MATKTITLEIDAYEKLKRAKRTPSESFSSVVRRASFPGEAMLASELLADMQRRLHERRPLVDAATLDALDAAQRDAGISPSEWR